MEAEVVGVNDRRARLETREVVLKPCNVDDIQVVGRLMKEPDFGTEEHRTRAGELPDPTGRRPTLACDWRSSE